MSVNNRLTAFAQQELVLGYNDIERERINASLTQLEKVIKDRFKGRLKEIARFGSYTRNTILPRKYDSQSDVDLLVVFDTSATRYTASTYRKQLFDLLAVTYPNSISKKDFPAVKLELNHIMFDVVPSYSEDFWGKTYYIPDSGDGWRSTSPNDLNSDLAKKNQSYGNNIVRNVIRLCKHWNAGANYPFQSYLMEKEIVETFFWYGDNLYEKFLSVLDSIAGNRPGVREALKWINEYKGTWTRQADETKQMAWLRRLLPGLI